MDIKYPLKNEYMKCVLQINGFSGPRPRVWSSRRVGSGGMTNPVFHSRMKQLAIDYHFVHDLV